jgi:hypothetical protein
MWTEDPIGRPTRHYVFTFVKFPTWKSKLLHNSSPHRFRPYKNVLLDRWDLALEYDPWNKGRQQPESQQYRTKGKIDQTPTVYCKELLSKLYLVALKCGPNEQATWRPFHFMVGPPEMPQRRSSDDSMTILAALELAVASPSPIASFADCTFELCWSNSIYSVLFDICSEERSASIVLLSSSMNSPSDLSFFTKHHSRIERKYSVMYKMPRQNNSSKSVPNLATWQYHHFPRLN